MITKEDLTNRNYNGSFIYFWKPKAGDLSTCFGQWYPSSFEVDGNRYTCAEQYMMAEKARLMGDHKTRQEILEATDPKLMKALGRKVSPFDPCLWNKFKTSIVIQGNMAKFSQNPELKDYLLNTGDAVLVEASPYDKVWGIGMYKSNEAAKSPKTWKGSNLLGFCLMEVRKRLS